MRKLVAMLFALTIILTVSFVFANSNDGVKVTSCEGILKSWNNPPNCYCLLNKDYPTCSEPDYEVEKMDKYMGDKK